MKLCNATFANFNEFMYTVTHFLLFDNHRKCDIIFSLKAYCKHLVQLSLFKLINRVRADTQSSVITTICLGFHIGLIPFPTT